MMPSALPKHHKRTKYDANNATMTMAMQSEGSKTPNTFSKATLCASLEKLCGCLEFRIQNDTWTLELKIPLFTLTKIQCFGIWMFYHWAMDLEKQNASKCLDSQWNQTSSGGPVTWKIQILPFVVCIFWVQAQASECEGTHPKKTT